MTYRLQILHGSLYGLSDQIKKYKGTKSTKSKKYIKNRNTKIENYKCPEIQEMQNIFKNIKTLFKCFFSNTFEKIVHKAK